MFHYLDITSTDGTVRRHIIEPLDDGGLKSWPLSDENPNKIGLDEWLAKGNTLTEWTPK
jgi:hypothetical protein